MNKFLLKLLSLATKPQVASPALGAIGGAAGNALADYEIDEGYYKEDATKGLAMLTGIGGGAIGGLMLGANPRKNLIPALASIGFTLGPKQALLAGTESFGNLAGSVKDYTKEQAVLAEANKIISQNQLDTSIQNKQVSENALNTSNKWLDVANKIMPFAGASLAAALGLYAYNSFKKRNKGLEDSVALQIPSEKLSPKFYNTLGREILFKDKEEDKRLNADAKNRELLSALDINDRTAKTAASHTDAIVLNNALEKSKNLPQFIQNQYAGHLIKQHQQSSNPYWYQANKWFIKPLLPALEQAGIMTPEENVKQYVDNAGNPLAINLNTSSYDGPENFVSKLHEFRSRFNNQDSFTH